MRYKVVESFNFCYDGLHCIEDTLECRQVSGYGDIKGVQSQCDLMNKVNERTKPMTPTQQHTERLRDCIKQVRSTLNQMERELETIEGIG